MVPTVPIRRCAIETLFVIGIALVGAIIGFYVHVVVEQVRVLLMEAEENVPDSDSTECPNYSCPEETPPE